jgi:hypothetical protein
MKLINLFIFAFLCIIIVDVSAQIPRRIVKEDLNRSFKKIDYWERQRDKNTTMAWSDSLENANDVFGIKLKYYTEKYPGAIFDSFDSLVKDHMDISSSTDGLFRIYSWDTETGGTMHFFENVMQYKSGAITKAIIDTPKREGDNRPNYNKIYTFKTNGKAYYLSIFLYISSTKDVAEGVHIFTIENSKLTDAKLIKTHSGLHSELYYDYDFRSVINIDYDKRPRIRFDNNDNIIYLPMVNSNYQVTNKFILYKFNGKYFERVKS